MPSCLKSVLFLCPLSGVHLSMLGKVLVNPAWHLLLTRNERSLHFINLEHVRVKNE